METDGEKCVLYSSLCVSIHTLCLFSSVSLFTLCLSFWRHCVSETHTHATLRHPDLSASLFPLCVSPLIFGHTVCLFSSLYSHCVSLFIYETHYVSEDTHSLCLYSSLCVSERHSLSLSLFISLYLRKTLTLCVSIHTVCLFSSLRHTVSPTYTPTLCLYSSLCVSERHPHSVSLFISLCLRHTHPLCVSIHLSVSPKDTHTLCLYSSLCVS